MTTPDPIVIVSAARTPMGAFSGELSSLAAPELGSLAIKAVLARAGIDGELVDEVLMGCVLPAGQGQAPARQAALLAGLPQSAGATTVNKVCGSGMKTVMLGHDLIAAGSSEVIVAGGMESMSNAPYLLPKVRSGLRLGHGEVKDHMFLDGLENAADGRAMGCFAQDIADEYGFTRQQMDDYALQSLQRAVDATAQGKFAEEILPVEVKSRKQTKTVSVDEGPQRVDPARIPQLKPAFSQGGTVTAANSSSISDGAAALLLMRASRAQALGLQPLAAIRGHAAFAAAPERFTTAPVGAIGKLLDQVGWQTPQVDLFEINEAFAVVTQIALRELDLDPARVNIFGGACALGHPIGASGARILVTLIHALRQQGGRRGVASLCIGGGEATAMAIELL